MAVINEKINDRVLLTATSALGVFGWVLFIDFSNRYISHTAFFIGFVLISLEFAMARNAVFTVFSKIIGPYPAGRYMGIMLAAGCLSRALSPFWAIHLMKISVKACAILCSGLLILAITILLFFWEKCSPHLQSVEANLIHIDLTISDSLYVPFLFENSETAIDASFT